MASWGLYCIRVWFNMLHRGSIIWYHGWLCCIRVWLWVWLCCIGVWLYCIMGVMCIRVLLQCSIGVWLCGIVVRWCFIMIQLIIVVLHRDYVGSIYGLFGIVAKYMIMLHHVGQCCIIVWIYCIMILQCCILVWLCYIMIAMMYHTLIMLHCDCALHHSLIMLHHDCAMLHRSLIMLHHDCPIEAS